MYLARQRIGDQTHYSIRHSYEEGGIFKSRQLFDLGTDPEQFIRYPGGNGYYYDPEIEDYLADQGVATDQTALDDVFFEFLPFHIQRVVDGFDRSRRRKPMDKTGTGIESPPPHPFDQRRYHYLRFGYSEQNYLNRVPAHIFAPLEAKSRDELEHYFRRQEQRLPSNEKAVYTSIIFRLNHWTADGASPHSLRDQLDAHFTDQLCRLNRDHRFMSGVPAYSGLSTYLIRYAVFYFDYSPTQRSAEAEYVRDFINRHRAHRPPAGIQVKMDEAARLFGHAWKTLKKMTRKELTRVYRQLALQHHPDQGGDAEVFRRLTQYYQALLHRKPRE